MAGYSITISAVDAASGVLERLNKRMGALNEEVANAAIPFQRLGENLQTFAEVTGIDKIATGFTNVAQAGGEAFRSLFRVIEPLAAITGAASLGGMYALISAWSNFGTTLGIQAGRAGLTADQLFTLQNAAKLGNISVEVLTGGMTQLSDNMRNAAFGGAPAFLDMLRRLKVDYREMQTLSPVDQLKRLAEALQKVKDPTDKALYTKELFGGEGMIPFLNAGAAGIDRLMESSRKLTGVFSPEDVERANEFNDAQEALTLSVTGLGHAIASVLGPVVTPLLNDMAGAVSGMRQWVRANEDWLRTEISKQVGEFITWIKGFDWDAIGKKIGDIVKEAGRFSTGLGDWIAVGKQVLIFFSVAWLAGMMAPIVAISAALLTLPGKAAAAAASSLGILGRLGIAAAGGYAAHEGMKALDPGDKMGAWIDRNIPGASWLDNQASKIGLGRSYEQQREVDRSLGYGPSGAAQQGGGTGGPGQGAAPIPRASGPGVSSQQQQDRAREAHDFFVEKGWTSAQASGIVANIEKESAFNERAVGDGGKAYGLFQHHPDRRADIEKELKKPFASLTFREQLEGAHFEMTRGKEQRAGNALRDARTASEAGSVVSRLFERPKERVHEATTRAASADRWGRHFAAMGPPAPRPPAANSNTPAPAQAAPVRLAANGDPAPLPSAGGPGQPGASGRVDLNVRVTGEPTLVTAQASPSVGVRIENPGLVGP